MLAKKRINSRAAPFSVVHVYTLAIRLHLNTIMKNKQFLHRPQRHLSPKCFLWARYNLQIPRLPRHSVRMRGSKPTPLHRDICRDIVPNHGTDSISVSVAHQQPPEQNDNENKVTVHPPKWLLRAAISISKTNMIVRMQMFKGQMAELKPLYMSLLRVWPGSHRCLEPQSQGSHLKTKDIFYSGTSMTAMVIWIILNPLFY